MQENAFNTLRDWLQIPKENDKAKTHATISSDLKVIDDSTKGRCIVAEEDIPTGKTIIKIPKNYLLNYITVLKHLSCWNVEIDNFLKEKIRNFNNEIFQTKPDQITNIYSAFICDDILKLTSAQLLALYICLERRRDEASFWKPFLSCLPELNEYDGIPMTWNLEMSTETDIRLFMLLPKSTSKHASNQITQFYSDFEKINNVLQDSNIKITEDEFLYSWLAINTRCLYFKLPEYLPITTTKLKEESNITMVPFVDYLNHQLEDSNSIAQETKSGYEVSTLSKICKNDHLWFVYGPHSDEFLQCEYGFSISEVTMASDETFKFKNLNYYNSVDISQLLMALLNNPKKKNVVEWLKQAGYYDDYTIGIDQDLTKDTKVGVSPSYRTRIAIASLIENDLEFKFNENQNSFMCPLKLERFYQGFTDGEYYEKFENILLAKILNKIKLDVKTKLKLLETIVDDGKSNIKNIVVKKLLINELLLLESFQPI